MPRRSGFSVLTELRALLPEARLVVVTAFDAGDVVDRSHSLGADACVEKVSLLTRLDHAVADYLDLPSAPLTLTVPRSSHFAPGPCIA